MNTFLKTSMRLLTLLIIFIVSANIYAEGVKLETVYNIGPVSVSADDLDSEYGSSGPSTVEAIDIGDTDDDSVISKTLTGIVSETPQQELIRVIIYLNQGIQQGIRNGIYDKYKDDTHDLNNQVKSILSLYASIRDSEAISDQDNYTREVLELSQDDKIYLQDIGHAREALALAIKDELKNTLISQTTNYQQSVVDQIIQLGGDVETQTTIGNAIIAKLPAGGVYSLTNNDKIISITEDREMQSHLNIADDATLVTSGYTGGSFWDNGQTGGIYDPAVLDSGTDLSHPALTNSADRSNFYSWYLVAADDHPDYGDAYDADDRHGHGTHVMGIVASYGSSGWEDYLGMSHGVDKAVTLKAGFKKTTGNASMYWSDAMNLVDRALYHDENLIPSNSFNDDVDGINISYGGLVDPGIAETGFCRFWDSVIMDDYSLAVTISAGNDGPGNTEFTDPGSAYNPITVANIDDRNTVDRDDDIIRTSSTRGPTEDNRKKPDIAAPGTNIYSCRHDWEDAYTPDFISKSGTSMSAPAMLGIIMDLKDAGIDDYLRAKALLLNTAQKNNTNIDFESDSDGWSETFGWGYVNAWAAYYHRNDTFKDSVTESGTTGDYNLYKGSMRDDPLEGRDKATVAWNRHANYNTASNPTTYYNLSNLNVRLYNENSNSLIDYDFDTNDNVHQVRVEEGAGNTDVVVKVYALDTNFPHGGSTEAYALATEENFMKVSLPNSFGASAYWPTLMEPGETHDVEMWVTNSSDIACHNSQWDVTLPTGWTLVSGSNPASFGSIEAGAQSAHTTWFFKAPNTTGVANIFYYLSHESYGELWDNGYATYTPITLEWDITPPAPTTMTFSVEPYALGETSIRMTATTASDARYNPCSYYFDMYTSPTGGAGGSDIGWTTATTVTDYGLTPNNQYGYRVRARDAATYPNANSYSSIKYEVTLIEESDGVEFGTTTPTSIQTRSINTPTNLNVGSSGLVIYNYTTGVYSGWKHDNTYWTNGGLNPNSGYRYRAKTRNITANERSFSPLTAIKYTLANIPVDPSFGHIGKTSLEFKIDSSDGNPSYTEYTLWFNGYYIDADGNNVVDPIWQTRADWSIVTINGLTAGTTYPLYLKARNEEGVETLWHGPVNVTTAICGDANHPYPVADFNEDCNVNIDDMNAFAKYWLYSPCSRSNSYCYGTDINFSGKVDLYDFSRLAEHWLESTEPDD